MSEHYVLHLTEAQADEIRKFITDRKWGIQMTSHADFSRMAEVAEEYLTSPDRKSPPRFKDHHKSDCELFFFFALVVIGIPNYIFKSYSKPLRKKIKGFAWNACDMWQNARHFDSRIRHYITKIIIILFLIQKQTQQCIILIYTGLH